MIIRKSIDINEPLTDEQIAMLKRAETMPIVFDEDSPELTEEDLSGCYRASERKNYTSNKETN